MYSARPDIDPAAHQTGTGTPLPHPREWELGAAYRAYLFGRFRVLKGGEPLDQGPRRNKARLVLEWFLLNPGRLVSADELIDLFWPESDPGKSLGNFHVTMHYLRRILEPGLHARQESAFIVRDGGNFYRFVPGQRWWSDVMDVELTFGRAQRLEAEGNLARACFYHRRIVAYCAMGLLPEEKPDDWLSPYRLRYRQIHLHALMRLMHHFDQVADEDELLEYAYQMLQVDDLNETAHRVIIESFIRSGNIAAAQDRLAVLENTLERRLGIRSTGDLRALSERVRSQSRRPCR